MTIMKTDGERAAERLITDLSPDAPLSTRSAGRVRGHITAQDTRQPITAGFTTTCVPYLYIYSHATVDRL